MIYLLPSVVFLLAVAWFVEDPKYRKFLVSSIIAVYILVAIGVL